MAIYDPEQNRIIIRVVYDGRALAGKTTNLERLCQVFGPQRRSELFSTQTDHGRTSYLDWLQIEGGVVSGRGLRCHLISVPGQAVLSRRRWRLLDLADSVIFVTESNELGIKEATPMLGTLRAYLKRRGDIPLILQANKQDMADALAPELVKQRLGVEVPCVGAAAKDNQGIRETLVLAIRAAADRVQRQVLDYGLESLMGDVKGGEALYRELRDFEEGDHRSPLDLALDIGEAEQRQLQAKPEATPISEAALKPEPREAERRAIELVSSTEDISLKNSTEAEQASGVVRAPISVAQVSSSAAPTAVKELASPERREPELETASQARWASGGNGIKTGEQSRGETGTANVAKAEAHVGEAPPAPAAGALPEAPETEAQAPAVSAQNGAALEAARMEARAALEPPALAEALPAEAAGRARFDSEIPTQVSRHDPSAEAVSVDSTDVTYLPPKPPLPAGMVPSGYIWPASTGRDILRHVPIASAELCDMPASRGLGSGVQPSQGDLVFQAGNWCLRTSWRRQFTSLDVAKEALVQLARYKMGLGSLMLDKTVLSLQPGKDGAYWLWTVTPWVPSLRSQMESAAAEGDDMRLGEYLSQYAEAVAISLDIAYRRGFSIILHPENYAVYEGKLRYVGDAWPEERWAPELSEALLARVDEYGKFPHAMLAYLTSLERYLPANLSSQAVERLDLVNGLKQAQVLSVTAEGARQQLLMVVQAVS